MRCSPRPGATALPTTHGKWWIWPWRRRARRRSHSCGISARYASAWRIRRSLPPSEALLTPLTAAKYCILYKSPRQLRTGPCYPHGVEHIQPQQFPQAASTAANRRSRRGKRSTFQCEHKKRWRKKNLKGRSGPQPLAFRVAAAGKSAAVSFSIRRTRSGASCRGRVRASSLASSWSSMTRASCA